MSGISHAQSLGHFKKDQKKSSFTSKVFLDASDIHLGWYFDLCEYF